MFQIRNFINIHIFIRRFFHNQGHESSQIQINQNKISKTQKNNQSKKKLIHPRQQNIQKHLKDFHWDHSKLQ